MTPDFADEVERVRADFAALIHHSDRQSLARRSAGTRWTNRELLFHMLLGYLITRNLRPLVRLISLLPQSLQRGFAASLNAMSRPFHVINYAGAVIGGRLLTPARMAIWMDAVTASLVRHHQRDSVEMLARSMPFPTGWDPYFTRAMTLEDVYRYAGVHYWHHRSQLTLGD